MRLHREEPGQNLISTASNSPKIHFEIHASCESGFGVTLRDRTSTLPDKHSFSVIYLMLMNHVNLDMTSSFEQSPGYCSIKIS